MDSWPAPSGVDIRRRISVYVTAVEDYSPEILKQAVTNFLKGRVADYKPAYAPSPGQLAIECRRILNEQITQQQLRKAAVLQIEQREEVFHMDPPALRKLTVERELGRMMAFTNPEETPEQIAEREANTARYLTEHDKHFLGNDTDDARRRRLMGSRT